jgi:hypothetical protein
MIKPPEPKIRSYLVCGILPILLRRKSEDVRARVLACEGQRTFYLILHGSNTSLRFSIALLAVLM